MTRQPGSYNHLSEHIKRQFRIKYCEYRGDGITVFKDMGDKWGAIRNDTELLIGAEHDSLYYNHQRKLFECVSYNEQQNRENITYSYFNSSGQLTGRLQGYSYVTIDKYGYFMCQVNKNEALDLEGETGTIQKHYIAILDRSFTELIPPVFSAASAISEDRFKAKHDEYWGIIDRNGHVVMEFMAEKIIGSFENEAVIVLIDGKYFTVDRSGSIKKELPYSHLLDPSGNSYWFNYSMDPGKMKALIGGYRREEDWYMDDRMVEYCGKFGVVNLIGEALIEPVYDYIDFFGLTESYMVFQGAMKFNYGDQWLELHDTVCGVVNLRGEVIVPLEYHWVIEIHENLWAVNYGGQVFYSDEYQSEEWTVKGGKWGVHNGIKLIVPVEYDNIMLSWQRVKDYIFVQKGCPGFTKELEHDVYDLKGNKIDRNKPDIRDCLFYP